MKLKKLLIGLLSVAMCGLMIGCAMQTSKVEPKETKTIKIGTTDADMEEMLLSVKEDYLQKGYEMEIQMFPGDYVTPNNAVAEDSLQANFYQHKPYLDEFNKNKGTNLVAIDRSIFYSNMAFYSNKIDSLDEVKDGMTMAMSSDATNRTRALKFMENQGLIKLKEGLEVYTKLDIEENKYNLEIIELDVAKLPSSLDDVDMIITYPFDMELAKIDKKPIVCDPSEIGEKYGISLVVDGKNKDEEWATTLVELLKGEKTKAVVEKYYKDTGVHISDY